MTFLSLRARMLVRKTPPCDRARKNMCVQILGSIGLIASLAAMATSAPDRSRFQLAGEGTLTLDQPAQKNDRVQLKAFLAPNDAMKAILPTAQKGGGFALTASLAATAMACYDDTIFRDDFDGDGL